MPPYINVFNENMFWGDAKKSFIQIEMLMLLMNKSTVNW